jgi:hypothetical protein
MIKMCVGLHVKCPLLFFNFNETSHFWTVFRKKLSNIKFRENPSSGSRIVPCGQKDGGMDGQTGRHDEANSRFSQCCEKRPMNNIKQKHVLDQNLKFKSQ